MHPAASQIGFDFQALQVLATQNVTIGAASAASEALGTTTRVVRLIATVPTWVAFRAAPTAKSASMYLPAGVAEYFIVAPGSKVAGLQGAGAGTLNIAEMK
jgi:hypothetical protein